MTNAYWSKRGPLSSLRHESGVMCRLAEAGKAVATEGSRGMEGRRGQPLGCCGG